eukprot:TRINITY_DN1176_c0_g1_i1.p1 TRINITY_DN1176_c0_g1~~TRINITY_DN1176_c0_g1_i1.p1  ORF type:complete len:980 (+),score=224.17 TRINITY_DN1176_c0_g1_i1:2-2941(+)
MGFKFILILILLFCSALGANIFNETCIYDYECMNCHNNGIYIPWQEGPPPVDAKCLCNQNYQGVDCRSCRIGHCAEPDFICDTSIYITNGRTYECYPTGDTQSLFGNGSFVIDCQWEAGQDSTGVCGITTYLHPDSAPRVFNCSATGCSKTISSNQQYINCDNILCDCTGWCGSIAKQVIDSIEGSAEIIVSLDGSLQLQQNSGLFTTQCKAYQCQLPGPPPVASFPWWAKLAIGGSAFGLLLIIGAASIIMMVSWKKKNQKYMRFGSLSIPLTLSWHHIRCSLTVKNPVTGKYRHLQILHGVSGKAVPGKVTAILGESGAGKTTFLDILAGRKNMGKIEGVVKVNGKEKGTDWKRVSAYVLQDDLMLATSTVREHLFFAAQMRLPSVMSDEQKKERVEEVMKMLRISHIADSMIGDHSNKGISGGEKRRVNIAAELVTDPSILFLDEPTSGLDSSTAYHLMENLVELARKKGKTIVFSIHQPRSNIFHLFDDVILLAHGHLVYGGSRKNSMQFLSENGYVCNEGDYNPADFLIDTVTMTEKEKIIELAGKFPEYRSRVLNENYEIEDDTNSLLHLSYFPHSSHPINNNNFNNRDKFSPHLVDNNEGDLYVPSSYNIENNSKNFDMNHNSHLNNSHNLPYHSSSPLSLNGEENIKIMEGEGEGERLIEERGEGIGGEEIGGEREGEEGERREASAEIGEHANPFILQFYYISQRTLKHIFRNPYLLRFQYAMIIIISLFLGGLYWHLGKDIAGVQDRIGCLFFIVALLSFGSLTSIDIFFSERSLYLREKANGYYSSGAYFAAKTVCDLIPMRVLPPIVLSSIIYYMIGLHPGVNHFLWFTLIVTLVSIVSTTFCLCVSTIIPSVGLGNLVAILFMLFFMLFGGFLVNKTNIPSYVSWLKWASFMNYAFEALMVNELNNLAVNFNPKGFKPIPINGRLYLQNFGLSVNHFYWDIYALFGLSIGFLVLAYVLLKTVKEKR